MRSYTHIAFSFLIGLLFIKYLDITNQVLFMMLIVLFSLVPDIDETSSKISKRFKIVSWIVKFFMGHRGIIHSIWIPIILYLLLFMVRIDVAIAVSFGYLSHLLSDALTPAGVQLLWPLKKKLRGFIKTGSLLEIVLFIVLLMVDVYLLVSF